MQFELIGAAAVLVADLAEDLAAVPAAVQVEVQVGVPVGVQAEVPAEDQAGVREVVWEEELGVDPSRALFSVSCWTVDGSSSIGGYMKTDRHDKLWKRHLVYFSL